MRLSKQNQLRLTNVNAIIEDYAEQGYKLTLRQLYYQLVTKNIIPNNDKEYAKLSTLLTKGRMAGVVDWNAIEDRIRVPRHTYYNTDIENALGDAVSSYRLDRMLDQDNYIELWVEKDALSNVLSRKTKYYHVRLMVNRGYSSTTAIYDSFVRISEAMKRGQKVNILYLGDHVPSGLDMVRDIRERLQTMLVADFEEDYVSKNLEVHHIGLTQEQIKLHEPPPNPTKVQDPRADWYINNFGETCWEVDALNPGVLHEVIDEKVKQLIDFDKFDAVLAKEELDKKVLKGVPQVRSNYLNIQEAMKAELPEKPKLNDYKEMLNKISKFI